jgi:hypothetical protein
MLKHDGDTTLDFRNWLFVITDKYEEIEAVINVYLKQHGKSSQYFETFEYNDKRPDYICTVSPDLSQSSHRLKEDSLIKERIYHLDRFRIPQRYTRVVLCMFGNVSVPFI